MASKLVPSDPSKVMVIRDVTPNITTLSLPFSRFGLFQVGGRGTIVRLTSGALSVFSPVALTPEVKAKLAEKGNNLRYIVAPDIEHHIFVTEWAKEFPQAQVIGPEGLPEKRAKNSSVEQVPFSTVFTTKEHGNTRVSEEFDRDFDYEYVPDHPNKELAFLYKPEKTLIVADLLFNAPPTEQYSRTGLAADRGIFTKLFHKIQSTQGNAIWQKRFLWYAASASNRPRFNKSASRIASWDFNRIIPCHGDVIENNARGVFKNVFEWHLNNNQN